MAAAVVFVAVILMKDPSKITELGVPTMAMLMSALRGRVVDSAE